ncbi:MAG: type I 3-dehydroquinate dehydratase [Lachnospiraceae bacterium]|nr:type I 3-dehydroquinate dehydratase [Lachnospiraceae bacterium]
MIPVTVRNVVFGQGRPKICVPIVAETEEGIFRAAEEIRSLPADLVEWRADWYENLEQPDEVVKTLRLLRGWLGEELPILFTIRTEKEGGQARLEPEVYASLNIRAAESGYADLVDVELFSGKTLVDRVVERAHGAGVKVILSSHDFSQTPPEEEMVSRLRTMQEWNADFLKLAVMPQSTRDVLALLSATVAMREKYAERPVITMSMGADGIVSRLAGEAFGSCLTFGCAGQASAPGQMGAEDLKTVLDAIHRAVK